MSSKDANVKIPEVKETTYVDVRRACLNLIMNESDLLKQRLIKSVADLSDPTAELTQETRRKLIFEYALVMVSRLELQAYVGGQTVGQAKEKFFKDLVADYSIMKSALMVDLARIPPKELDKWTNPKDMSISTPSSTPANEPPSSNISS